MQTEIIQKATALLIERKSVRQVAAELNVSKSVIGRIRDSLPPGTIPARVPPKGQLPTVSQAIPYLAPWWQTLGLALTYRSMWDTFYAVPAGELSALKEDNARLRVLSRKAIAKRVKWDKERLSLQEELNNLQYELSEIKSGDDPGSKTLEEFLRKCMPRKKGATLGALMGACAKAMEKLPDVGQRLDAGWNEFMSDYSDHYTQGDEY